MTNEDTSYDQDLAEIKKRYQEYLAKDSNLCRSLRSVGLGEAMIVRIIDFFRIETYDIVFNKNPYRLMEIEGIGFTKADNVARQLGIQSEDPRRQAALILYVLETNKNFGHVYLPITILEKECKKQNVHKFNDMVQELIKAEVLVVEENRIYSNKLYIAECEVAEMLKERI